MSDSIWTEERTEELVALVGEGVTYEIIATRMGLTKNQAIGKAQRLGLGHPRPPKPAAALVDFPPRAQCVWPQGHPGEAGFHFCCAAVAVGSGPYCPPHRQRAYTLLRAGSDDLE